MIAKLAGSRADGRGSSFKTLFAYVFHDKDHARTANRLAWAEPLNCALNGRVGEAWYEMFVTWAMRSTLKRAAGIAMTGRDNHRPVLHLSLSWHPKETPTREDMLAAGRSALEWLGLEEHQAVIAAHTDEPQPHIHLIINTVHPTTGKTAHLYQCKKTLSAWAAHWEETHGGVIVESRPHAQPRLTVRAPFSDAATQPNPPLPLAPRLAAVSLAQTFNRVARRLLAPLLVLFGSRNRHPPSPDPSGPASPTRSSFVRLGRAPPSLRL